MSRMKDRKRKAKRTLFIPDLSKVEARVVVPEGQYRVRVAEIEVNDGNKAEYYRWMFEIAEGEYKGRKLFYITSLAEQALWNLRSLLESLNVDIEEGDMELDLEDLIGRELIVLVEHDVYEGKKQARVVDFSAVEDSADDESEDDEEEEEEEEDPKARRRRERRERRKAKKHRDEEEEEEEEAPRRRKKSSKKEPELDRDEIMDMSEDELVELCEEHELDVDLDDYPTLRKKKAAVVSAAEEAGLL